MIGEWNPSATTTETETVPTSNELRQLAAAADNPASAAEQLRNRAANWIRSSQSDWEQSLSDLADAELINIAFFYIRAEQTLSGFESGSNNPAIRIFRYLKSQGRKPGKDIVRKMKAETDNRFIPHGDALT
ncbi:hypothetical protein [Thalassolituus sp.]|uniref:hypothetical protein n=1 Tax=Thalassolituus sp. TaxID=2030822 RepID=UPI002615DBA8|nr:hypothetical protein [Thalassolituus sp.]